MSNHDPKVWEYLEADIPRRDAFTARVAFPALSKAVLAAIDSDGKRHFLISLSSTDEDLNDSRSRGVRVTTDLLRVKKVGEISSESRYVDILCLNSDGFEAFYLLGRDIADALAPGNVSVAEGVHRTLEKWRYFWGKPPSSQLTKNEVVGLLTELWFLDIWLLPHNSIHDVVFGWRGPYGSRHDYEWDGISVEAKGTTSVDRISHWINGIEQLAPPDHGQLLLFSLQLREENGGNFTLPALINDCRNKIGNDYESLEIFDSALVQTGYSPVHDEDYDRLRFRVVSEALYEVRGSFPRLISDSFRNGVPSGVGEVEYRINLQRFDSFIVAHRPEEFKLQEKTR